MIFKKYNGNYCIDANSYNNINILALIPQMIKVPKYLN